MPVHMVITRFPDNDMNVKLNGEGRPVTLSVAWDAHG